MPQFPRPDTLESRMLEVVAAGHGARVDGVDYAVGVGEVGFVEPDLPPFVVLAVGIFGGVLILGHGLGLGLGVCGSARSYGVDG